jgi:RNA polymerase sigma factor (TIGR02999 family)
LGDEQDITRMLRERGNDPERSDRLYAAVHGRLRRLAHGRLRGRRGDPTLGTTALVNEAYLKRVDQSASDWKDRNHFFAVAATAMRQIVIDEARSKAAHKRGGQAEHVPLDDDRVGSMNPLDDLLALDRALDRLARIDERLSRVVEMRFFAGYSVEEAAEVLGQSSRTVKRDWRKARALLLRDLHGTGGEDGPS